MTPQHLSALAFLAFRSIALVFIGVGFLGVVFGLVWLGFALIFMGGLGNVSGDEITQSVKSIIASPLYAILGFFIRAKSFKWAQSLSNHFFSGGNNG